LVFTIDTAIIIHVAITMNKIIPDSKSSILNASGILKNSNIDINPLGAIANCGNIFVFRTALIIRI